MNLEWLDWEVTFHPFILSHLVLLAQARCTTILRKALSQRSRKSS